MRLVSQLSNLLLSKQGCPCGYCLSTPGERSQFIVCQNDVATALIPIRPRIRGNVVVVPHAYHTDFSTFNQSEFRDLFKCVRESTFAVENLYDPDGTNVWCDWGGITGRSYLHLVWEIVPRSDRKAGRKYRYTDIFSCPQWSSPERAKEAARLRGALNFSK
ncbi:HIT domain-containing protein [Microbulbifer sp. EKSA008]|uniref:HIT domain-containing protein n=1 Tax=unclassified Microbulbifer TaxID=2619833 RepID=UPI004038FD7E